MKQLILILALILAPVLSARAEDQAMTLVSADDRAAIHAVVEAQITAFSRDDGPAAYALASTGLKSLFNSPASFMEVVQRDYDAVYRAKSVTYLGVAEMEGKPVQQVMVISPSGEPMLALFVMAREAAGLWRVEGCYLVRRPMMSA